MTRLTMIQRLAIAAAALTLAPACGVDFADENGGDGDGDADVPADVQAAFEESCGLGGCHDANGSSVGLSLTGNNIANAIGTPAGQRSDLSLIEIGNVGGSYVALKMLPNSSLSVYGEMINGGPMPPGGGTAQDQQNMALILGWIAGADLSMTADAEAEQTNLWGDIDVQPTPSLDDDRALSAD